MQNISVDFYCRISINADMAKTPIDNMQPVESSTDTLLDTKETAKVVVTTRTVLNISQKALAIEMGIKQSYLCDLEKGNRRWSMALFNNAKESLSRIAYPK
jgi:predicted transcriptional regulator